MHVATETIKAAIRFHPSDAGRLRTIAALSAQQEDVGFFRKAAESAEEDEPLIIYCTPEELRYFTDRMHHWGISRSADQLTSPRRDNRRR